jgi:hypothetical protein
LAVTLKTDKASAMPTRKTHKQDNPEQSKRFINMAREIGVDESPEALDRAFVRVVRAKTAIKPVQRERK